MLRAKQALTPSACLGAHPDAKHSLGALSKLKAAPAEEEALATLGPSSMPLRTVTSALKTAACG